MVSGSNLLDQLRYLLDPVRGWHLVQGAVPVAQPLVFDNIDGCEALGGFPFAGKGKPIRRPGLRVIGPRLTLRGGGHSNPVPGGSCHRHQPGGHVGLVVRMRPDAEQGAQLIRLHYCY